MECVDVTIVDNISFEGPEIFSFVISPEQADEEVIVGSPNLATVIINDPEDSMYWGKGRQLSGIEFTTNY